MTDLDPHSLRQLALEAKEEIDLATYGSLPDPYLIATLVDAVLALLPYKEAWESALEDLKDLPFKVPARLLAGFERSSEKEKQRIVRSGTITEIVNHLDNVLANARAKHQEQGKGES
jgi:hypothetical protein